jgi:5'-3' exonuclease
MGVQDLSKEFRPSRELTSNISQLRGKIVGIDASIYLNKALNSSPEISLLFHQEPSVTVGHLIRKYFDRFYRIFEANDIKILFVLDGARNPMKSVTNDSRKKNVLMLLMP